MSEQRAVKFRVRDAETKKIVGYEYLEDGAWMRDAVGDENRCHAHAGTYYGVFDPVAEGYIREQFTGKLDKDKTEVYQGDIFDVDDGGRRCEVVWFEPEACFDTKVLAVINKEQPFAVLRNASWSYRCKVLGSIHDQEGSNGL